MELIPEVNDGSFRSCVGQNKPLLKLYNCNVLQWI